MTDEIIPSRVRFQIPCTPSGASLNTLVENTVDRVSSLESTIDTRFQIVLDLLAKQASEERAMRREMMDRMAALERAVRGEATPTAAQAAAGNGAGAGDGAIGTAAVLPAATRGGRPLLQTGAPN